MSPSEYYRVTRVAVDTVWNDDDDAAHTNKAHYFDDAAVDIRLFLRQLERLILARRIRPGYTALGRVTLMYFDEKAAARGDEPFRGIYLPHLQLPKEGGPDPIWPNN